MRYPLTEAEKTFIVVISGFAFGTIVAIPFTYLLIG